MDKSLAVTSSARPIAAIKKCGSRVALPGDRRPQLHELADLLARGHLRLLHVEVEKPGYLASSPAVAAGQGSQNCLDVAAQQSDELGGNGSTGDRRAS